MKNKLILVAFSIFFLLPLTAMAMPSGVEFDDRITEGGIVTFQEHPVADSHPMDLPVESQYTDSI